MSTCNTIWIGSIDVGKEFEVPVDCVRIVTQYDAQGNVINQVANDVVVTITCPNNVTFLNANIPEGTFDNANKLWLIDELSTGEKHSGVLTFRSDVCDVDQFTFNISITSSSTEVILENNFDCVQVWGIGCESVNDCLIASPLDCLTLDF